MGCSDGYKGLALLDDYDHEQLDKKGRTTRIRASSFELLPGKPCKIAIGLIQAPKSHGRLSADNQMR